MLDLPDTTCYPRPLAGRIPILVGGSGERRTLPLVARYADGCNLFGDPATVERKLAVLRTACVVEGRDPGAVEVTHLSTALAAPTRSELAAIGERLRPGRSSPARYAASIGGGTTAELVDRFGALAEGGVRTAIVRLADLGREDDAIARFRPVIDAFARAGR